MRVHIPLWAHGGPTSMKDDDSGKPLNILYLIDTFGRGGAETSLLTLTSAMIERGHTCTVVSLMQPSSLQEDFQRLGAADRCLSLKHRWDFLTSRIRLTTLINEVQPDLIHAHLFLSSLHLALLLRRRQNDPARVVSFHNLDYDSYPAKTILQRARKRFDGFMMKHRVDLLLAPSAAVKEHYERHLGVRVDSIVANPVSFITTPGFEKRTERKVVCVGRLAPEKNQMLAIKAVQHLAEEGHAFDLHLIGDGPLRGELETEVRRSGLVDHVHFHGELPHHEALGHITTSVALLSCSTHEGFGMAVAEAMAAGTPVVATQAGAIRELVASSGSGVVVGAEPALIAGALHSIISDKVLWGHMAKRGMEYAAAELSQEGAARRFEFIYRRALNQRGWSGREPE